MDLSITGLSGLILSLVLGFFGGRRGVHWGVRWNRGYSIRGWLLFQKGTRGTYRLSVSRHWQPRRLTLCVSPMGEMGRWHAYAFHTCVYEHIDIQSSTWRFMKVPLQMSFILCNFHWNCRTNVFFYRLTVKDRDLFKDADYFSPDFHPGLMSQSLQKSWVLCSKKTCFPQFIINMLLLGRTQPSICCQW